MRSAGAEFSSEEHAGLLRPRTHGRPAPGGRRPPSGIRIEVRTHGELLPRRRRIAPASSVQRHADDRAPPETGARWEALAGPLLEGGGRLPRPGDLTSRGDRRPPGSRSPATGAIARGARGTDEPPARSHRASGRDSQGSTWENRPGTAPARSGRDGSAAGSS
jgi:hypothetical protein